MSHIPLKTKTKQPQKVVKNLTGVSQEFVYLCIYLCVELSGREGHGSDRRQPRLAVGGNHLVLSVQESRQALLQHLIGYGATGGVDKLRVEVEGAGRGPTGELVAPTGLQTGLQDLKQLGRGILQEAKERKGKC